MSPCHWDWCSQVGGVECPSAIGSAVSKLHFHDKSQLEDARSATLNDVGEAAKWRGANLASDIHCNAWHNYILLDFFRDRSRTLCVLVVLRVGLQWRVQEIERA